MVTKKICDFVVENGYEQMPKAAIETAKLAILDMLGAAIAGAQQPASMLITEYVRNMGGKAESSVIAKTFKTSAQQAALCNGALGHVLDYDDASYTTQGHPTVVLLPAILAVAEKNRLSGKAVLESYILGFEVAAKIGLGLGFGVYQTGWHCTSTIGVMGAAVASAKLIKLDVKEMATALGIAGSLSSGLRQNFGTMTKPLHAGVAAHNGVMSAVLAGKGFTADINIIESPMGYGHIYSQGRDLKKISHGLGDPFDIVVNGLAFKPYPSCRFTHHLIDATLHLVSTNDIVAADIMDIECHISPVVTTVLIHHRPKTALEGKFSLEYCVARAILNGTVRLEHFTDESVLDKKVQVLIHKIRYTHVHDKSGEKLGEGEPMPPAGVTLRLRNGVELHHTIQVPKGDPGNSMSTDELITKFRDCADNILSDQKIDRCVDLVLHLESIKDIRKLMDNVV